MTNSTDFGKAAAFVDNFYINMKKKAKQFGYENKVEEIMIILGYEYDQKKYKDFFDATVSGWKPKTLDIAEKIKAFETIDAVLHPLSLIKDTCRSALEKKYGSSKFPANWRDLFGIDQDIIKVTSTEYTGKWIKEQSIPLGWISLQKFSPTFTKKSLFKGIEIFAVPKPIGEIIANFYQD